MLKGNGEVSNIVKIERKVAFDRKLNFKRSPSFGIEGKVQQYKLRGVIEHTGKNTNEGHYHAYVREGDNWVWWSDEKSKAIHWEEVKEKQAYILIWEKSENKTESFELGTREEPITDAELEERESNDAEARVKLMNSLTPMNIAEENNEMIIDSKGKKRRREEHKNIMSRKSKGEPDQNH